MFKWRTEGDPIPQGLSFYRFNDPGSLGFILNLDRLWVRLRYSKRWKRFHWECRRREPRAWRLLKQKDKQWHN